MTTSPPSVAYCRINELGSKGNDVIAHKRAISRAFPTLYPWWQRGFSPYYGETFRNAVKGAQLIMKLPTTGKIDKATHDKLRARHAANKPGEWAFDDYAIQLAKQYCLAHPVLTRRQKIVNAGLFWYGHRSSIAYSQVRPFQLCKPQQVPSRWDCSAFVTNCHYAGGAPDPNGRGYDGQGYTGTLINHGHKVNFNDLELGDLIFYGFSSGRPGFSVGDPTHVALYAGGGNVLSNGRYPMSYYEYDYRRDINCYVHYDI